MPLHGTVVPLYPNGAPTYAGPGWPMGNPIDTVNGWTKFFQEIRFQETYMYDHGDRKVSFNDIETSAALPHWNSAALTVTVTNQSGAVTFPAPGAPTGAQRFYRAVWE